MSTLSSNSKLALAALPVIVGLGWWLLQSSKSNPQNDDCRSKPDNLCDTEIEESQEESLVPDDTGSPNELFDQGSLARVEVRKAGRNKGRGLFCTQSVHGGTAVCCIRPALVLLFQPHCYTHCIGCFADLHKTPGRRCGECERFAVCRECDISFDLFQWHKRGECQRWCHLPPALRSQPKLGDVLFLLVRFRSCLDEDMDFTDLAYLHQLVARTRQAMASRGGGESATAAASAAAANGGIGENASDTGEAERVDGQALAAAAQAAAAAADRRVAAVRFPPVEGKPPTGNNGGGGDGTETPKGKEGVGLLEALQLQANENVALPEDQLRMFSQLTGLEANTIKTLIFRLRTNAGSIRVKGTSLGCALSATLSFLNHSCEPNATAQVVAGHLLVTARRPLVPGEELLISYVDATGGRAARRAILKGHYGFDCDCARCAAEEGFNS